MATDHMDYLFSLFFNSPINDQSLLSTADSKESKKQKQARSKAKITRGAEQNG